ncbi:Oidioi.mRNA.OKI2018_I69.XSR.g15314.t1.cds [Oikopleura dioica]|uniref:Oidioi.mRNA.OKI2018_I69.XSR.g15314.t1.cds n=1 Tax=Oikopleura dioica TaxID=34765 RepID=A0ABN7SIT6_OIKDI|nr:Oidioi.mRNA.OKI2018_I69.XSR.g15314.t1.cds [Oikopleura dioica]
MVKVLDLPIYDPPGSAIKPIPMDVANMEVVLTNCFRDFVKTPSLSFCADRNRDLLSAREFLFTPIGAAQVATLAGSFVVGRKFANRLLPVRQHGSMYTRPFLAANYALQVAVPLGTTCAWYETPREWTIWALKNSVIYSANAVYYTVYYSFWLVGKFFGLIWSAIAGFFGMIWAAIKGVFMGAWWVVKTTGNGIMAIGSLFGSSEEEAPAIEVTKEEPVEEEGVNPTEVELELKSAKRHAQEEHYIPLPPCKENCDDVASIGEDLGQSEEDDKELYPSRRR